MDTTSESTFVEDSLADQQLQSRNHGASQKSKRVDRAASPFAEDVGEDVPLLYAEDENRALGTEEAEWTGFADFEGLPWWKRPSIYWLLPTFFCFTFAYGSISVPKLNLIMDLVCKEYYASGPMEPIDPDRPLDRCRTDAVLSRAALFLLWSNLVAGILSAFASPKLGALSDRYGRKRILSLTTMGALGAEILTILAAKFPETVHINWILVGYAIDGLCGSFIVAMALAYSYAADCTPPQKRNVAFGYFQACLFMGIALGPAAAGYIINARAKYVGKTEAVLLIFYLALGVHTFCIMFLAFIIPESQSKTRLKAAQELHRQGLERMGPATDWIQQLRQINLIAPLKILWPTGPGTTPALRRNLVLLATTDTIVFGIAMGALSVVLLYTRLEFGWGELASGRFVSVSSGTRVVSLLVLLPLITRLIRGKPGTTKQRNTGSDRFDLTLVRAAVLLDLLGYLGYVLVRDGNLFLASGMVAALGGIGSPTLSSALTKHVPADRVGELLGATGLLHALARVVGPTIFNGIFAATLSTFRQTVFVCLAASFAVAFASICLVRPHIYLEDLQKESEEATIPNDEVSANAAA